MEEINMSRAAILRKMKPRLIPHASSQKSKNALICEKCHSPLTGEYIIRKLEYAFGRYRNQLLCKVCNCTRKKRRDEMEALSDVPTKYF